MAEIVCNNQSRLTVVLFGQQLRFSKLSQGSVKCQARQHPFPDVFEDQGVWASRVREAVLWFDGTSPRATLELGPTFGQTIRLREGPPGSLACEALHDGSPGATEDPAQLEAVLDVIEAWLAAAGVVP